MEYFLFDLVHSLSEYSCLPKLQIFRSLQIKQEIITPWCVLEGGEGEDGGGYKPPVADYREVHTSQPASLTTRKYKEQQQKKWCHFYSLFGFLSIDRHTRRLREIYSLG